MTTFLLYSATTSTSLEESLGSAEYSYYFVREKFRAMLERRATVTVVADPENEVDAIYDLLRAQGRDCIFLCFCPPHRMPRTTRCPTVPIFAWEFDSIPSEVWDDDERNDWRTVLARCGQAITHSQYSARAIKSAMGIDFHVEAMAAPVWDHYQPPRGNSSKRALDQHVKLELNRAVVDSRRPTAPVPHRSPVGRLEATGAYAIAWYRDVIRDLLPLALRKLVSQLGRLLHRFTHASALGARANKPGHELGPSIRSRQAVPLELRGAIFLSVFNPADGRKNWIEMLTAFCCSLATYSDATLILKFVNANSSAAMDEVRGTLAKLRAFQCRVIAIDEFLDDDRYRQLLAAATFVVNASLAEGQCLPLMEAMSCGTPVISPCHTGMSEYVDGQVGFVLRSSQELCCWPHDPRGVFRARRYRGDWQSLVEAYCDAYKLAKEQPESYQRMSKAAITRMRDYCSQLSVFERLERFLHDGSVLAHTLPKRSPVAATASVMPEEGRRQLEPGYATVKTLKLLG
jgi:glycosyltransferase involved in cell wall biosynthesis